MRNKNNQSSQQPIVRQSGRAASILFSIIMLAAAGAVLLFRQDIKDWAILQTYHPTSAIQQLADGAGLSNYGRQVFYAQQPELHGRSDFLTKCQAAGDENSNVLGCYIGQRIYVFDVQDQTLSGVREVTAAHEMLHAAYERLSSSERDHINQLVQKQLDTQVDDHIKQLITLYNRIEPGELLNEMHSILGTEQANLSPELETYYSQYFTKRSQVVALATSYQAVFDSLKAKQASLAKDLDSLAATINSSTQQLNADVTSFNSDVSAFNAKASSGTMTKEEFDSQRAALTVRKNDLANRRSDNDSLRSQYDEKRTQLNSLAIEFNSLQQKVNSKPDSLTDVH